MIDLTLDELITLRQAVLHDMQGIQRGFEELIRHPKLAKDNYETYYERYARNLCSLAAVAAKLADG